MRLLILSDAGVPTGFGHVVDQIGNRLATKHGWEVSVLASNWRGDTVDSAMRFYLPTQLERQDIYGQSRFIELLGKIVPDAIFILNDPHVVLSWMFLSPWDQGKALWSGVTLGEQVYRPPIVHYCPVDGYDSPRSWNILDERVMRIAMSKFGRDTAIPGAPVVWHGVDSKIFHPADKSEVKRKLGYDPERFLIVRADKQSTRKDYPALWKALRPLLRKYDDIDVHWHCLPRAIDGYDMNAVRYNDEDIRDRVNFSPGLTGYTGWPEEMLATLLAAADLYVTTSWGEGFGLLPLQALACGTPVIATDCSAITEVVGPGGILVPPAGRITVPMGQEQCLPDIAGFTQAIEHLYLDRSKLRYYAERGLRHSEKFSWEVAAARMDTILRAAVAAQQSEQAPTPVEAVAT